jgi:prolipoprotein diacylglyceryltransferase
VITQPLLGGFFTLYGIIFSLSAAAGLGLSIWLWREEKILLLNVGLGILSASLVAARIGFVLRNFSYFVKHLGQIPQFWKGGLSWPGALIGAITALVAIHFIWKEPLGELADRLIPLYGIIVVTTWLTGWGAGIAYGPQLDAWYAIPVMDILGKVTRRWPLPVLGALLSGGWISGVLFFPMKKERRPGIRAVVAVWGSIAINLIISLYRVDPAPRWLGLRWESWFSIVFLVAGVVYLVIERKLLKNERTDP